MPEIKTEIAARIRAARGFIFDMDGTLVIGDAKSEGHAALPHAIDVIKTLHSRSTPFRIFTNGTAKTPAEYADSLRHAGFPIEDWEMMTPSSSAADWFAAKSIRRVRVLGLHGVQEPLRARGIETIGPSQPATDVEAVYTGWFREFTFPDLEAACRDVWAGAILTTASNVPFFAAKGGRAIGASFAINAMIRSVTGKSAKVLGKPSTVAFHCALTQMALPRNAAAETIVVGDDPALEMRMARSCGAFGIGVTTGLASAETMMNGVPAARPDIVIGGLASILEALR